MIKFKHFVAATLAAILSSAVCMADDNVNKFGSDSKISDLALIYAGNSNRPAWNKEDLTPYLTHKYADGSESWLFDGFLFLETFHGSLSFGNGSNHDPALQADWLWLLDEFFTPDRKLDALDKLIEEKKATLGEPILRHKVVITCCAPTKIVSGKWSRTPWGTVNGKKIIFINPSDRVTAVKWYIDTLLEKWKAANFKNIDLEGIYWIEEGLYSNGDIIAEINDYVHSKGLRSYWIPYFLNNEMYYSKWRDEYKFDMCYLQPNYAFLDDKGQERPYSQLTDAVDTAKRYGMGLELEFETQATSNAMHSVNPALHQHINDYMDVFDYKNVFKDAGVAYYTGTQGLIHMDRSTDPVDHQTIDRLANYVVARQKVRASSTSISEIKTDTATTAYTRDGKIIITEDSCCHDLAGRLIFKGIGEIKCNPGVYLVSDTSGRSVKLLVK